MLVEASRHLTFRRSAEPVVPVADQVFLATLERVELAGLARAVVVAVLLSTTWATQVQAVRAATVSR